MAVAVVAQREGEKGPGEWELRVRNMKNRFFKKKKIKIQKQVALLKSYRAKLLKIKLDKVN